MVWQAVKQAWWRHQLKDSAYDFLLCDPTDQDLICFDCETTGLNPAEDQILSLSAIKIRGSEILTSQSLNLTFKARDLINPESIRVHRLRNIDVVSGLGEREAIGQFLAFIGSRPLVGYYLDFDVAMVNQVIKPWLGIHLPNPKIEVSELFYKAFYKKHAPHQSERLDLSFNAILDKLDLPKMGQHDAFNDALMTAMIYVKLQSLAKG